MVERRTGTPLMQVRFPGAARDFSPRVNFQCRLSPTVSVHPSVQSQALTSVRTLKICPCQMETLKRPACTVGWVARLCRGWLSLGKATRISRGRNLSGTIVVKIDTCPLCRRKTTYVISAFTMAVCGQTVALSLEVERRF